MKYLSSSLLAVVATFVSAAPSEVWLEKVPASAGTSRDWTEAPVGSFFEVPASKLGTAEAWLADSTFLAQEQSGITYFGRPDFNCPAPTKPYLIRAAYVNGGTGRFRLNWAGSALVVTHASLGPSGTPSRSALVACLPQAPNAVYSYLPSAL